VRLAEHSDFKTLIARTSADQSLPEPWVEKDYYLTEVLRIVARVYPTQGFLKGGTSLTKGWALLSRMSEDIDWVLIRSAFTPTLGGKDVNARLARLATEVAEHPDISWAKSRTGVVDGKARHDYYDYNTTMTSRTLGLAETILLEAGTRAGNWPLEKRQIQSLVGMTAESMRQGGIAEDTTAFSMLVLDFRRTFVEKLVAVHSFVRRFVADGIPLARNARHYADLFVLLQRDEVKALVGGVEFAAILDEQDALAKEHFKRNYVPLPESFRESEALFPGRELSLKLKKQYDDDVRPLFFGKNMPPFEAVLGAFAAMKDRF
jgi:nucleotidyltransferase AbiEii toxin of type IV toxin-antitoxin system